MTSEKLPQELLVDLTDVVETLDSELATLTETSSDSFDIVAAEDSASTVLEETIEPALTATPHSSMASWQNSNALITPLQDLLDSLD